MKNVIIILFFAVAISSCSSSSGDTTCMVQMYDTYQVMRINDKSEIVRKMMEVKVRKGTLSKLREGQDVWVYQYYDGTMGKASDWRVTETNRYGKDTIVIEEVIPNYSSKTSTYKRAKLMSF